MFDEADYTIIYRTAKGEEYVRYVRRPKKLKELELQTGDESALDAFLGGFANTKK